MFKNLLKLNNICLQLYCNYKNQKIILKTCFKLIKYHSILNINLLVNKLKKCGLLMEGLSKFYN